MGKGGDQSRLIPPPTCNLAKSLLSPQPHESNLTSGGSNANKNTQRANKGPRIPPGIPECDVILKGNTRFWYIELGFVAFGIVGMIVSAIMLVRIYLANSSS